MTDEQIVKAWEKCIDATMGCCGDDTTCPYCTDEEEGCAKCFEKLRIDVLDLIKRQQAEIEEQDKAILNALKRMGEVRAEAIKEFAERLKEKATSTFYEERKYVDTEDIDELVREMTEEGK